MIYFEKRKNNGYMKPNITKDCVHSKSTFVEVLKTVAIFLTAQMYLIVTCSQHSYIRKVGTYQCPLVYDCPTPHLQEASLKFFDLAGLGNLLLHSFSSHSSLLDDQAADGVFGILAMNL